MNIEMTIRKLARSRYYQSLYRQSKEFHSLSLLFGNTCKLSGLQLYFLEWLQIYDSIYTDLLSKESIYLDGEVIDDDIRCDAYLYYKRIIRDKELVENRNKKETDKFRPKGKGGNTPGEMHDIQFRREE